MNITNNFVILSKDTAIDTTDHTLSLFKIIDKFDFNITKDEYEKIFSLGPNNLVNLPINYSIATSWSTGSKLKLDFPFRIRLDVIDPNEKIISSVTQDIIITKGNDSTRFTINVQGMSITVEGRYSIKAIALGEDNKELASRSTPLDINIIVN